MKNKVFVGVSGGVDSSVSAYLLKEEYDVTGVMFRNYDDSKRDNLANQIAKNLNIQVKVLDLRDEFKKLIINPFVNSYKIGGTPNPCINCNINFKFGMFANWCFENGVDYIATGHYCKTKDGRLFKGKDKKKDQSYFLSGVSGDILKKTLFPLGNYKKDEVRKIAKKIELPNSQREESQEICFIKESMNSYLDKYIDGKIGNIVDIDSNEILGEHNGLHTVTLGQRRGLLKGGDSEPYFVAKKDSKSNTIYVAKGKDNPKLWKDTFTLEDFNTINNRNIGIKNNLKAVVRYNAREITCSFDWDSNTVVLRKKVWTPSEGQTLAIYKKDECIGGGIIKEIRQ